jgi:hypothetical protein
MYGEEKCSAMRGAATIQVGGLMEVNTEKKDRGGELVRINLCLEIDIGMEWQIVMAVA